LTNGRFGSERGVEKANRDIRLLYPAFRDRVHALLAEMNRYAARRMPGIEWRLVEGLRSSKRQQALFAQGRSTPGPRVTNLDGVRRRSAHQYGLAADLAPFARGKLCWDILDRHWAYLGHVARSLGLTWGGDWRGFPDRPHAEWPRSDRGTYRMALEWVKGELKQ
jgi:peptidoglycan L-alanyl-D-glutamate endopeptidase CwlK